MTKAKIDALEFWISESIEPKRCAFCGHPPGCFCACPSKLDHWYSTRWASDKAANARLLKMMPTQKHPRDGDKIAVCLAFKKWKESQ